MDTLPEVTMSPPTSGHRVSGVFVLDIKARLRRVRDLFLVTAQERADHLTNHTKQPDSMKSILASSPHDTSKRAIS
jgi:hypothetical protein